MLNTNFLYGVTGIVADIPTANRATIQFILEGVTETAFLKSHRFYKDGKCLGDNQNLSKYLKIGEKVKFSCHINDNSNPGQCKWFVANCWRHVESKRKTVVLSGGIMNVAGTVTSLKQRQGILTMSDLLGNEYKIHFLGSKFYNYGKRLGASKPLSSQLQIDDKVYFDAIPCFPEENIEKCNWFATCVHKGKKPENFLYKDQSKSEVTDIGKEKIFNQSFGSEESPTRNETEFIIDQSNVDSNGNFNSFGELLPVQDINSTTELESGNPFFNEHFIKSTDFSNDDKHSSDRLSIGEIKLNRGYIGQKVEPCSKFNAEMLHDIKLLTMNPKTVFAQSTGIVMDIINEEYGVILGEFEQNNFQTILFHRSNAFLFKTKLADSKLTEIFMEGDRVKFIAVEASKQFVCEWIATQVSVAYHETEEEEEINDEFSNLDAIENVCDS